MNNRPGGGRKRRITGKDTGSGRRGEGLNSGPVGHSGGYSGRPTSQSFGSGSDSGYGSGSNVTRGGGISKIIIIVLIAVFLFGGGSGLLSNLFGGGSSSSGSSSNNSSSSSSGSSFGSSALSMLGSLLGGSGSGVLDSISNVSSGWKEAANTGKLNTSVASGARDKYTKIAGNGNDKVTLMVYMCGTDLESKHGMATSDIQEMSKATIGSNVNLLVYTGGCKQWQNSIFSNSVNQIYKVESGGVRALVKDDGKDSMVKPSTLTRFIKYCTDNYPANRNQLILWDHGSGSLAGYGYDEKNSMAGSMTLKGISEALKNAGTKFDFIGFDACLMATLENGLMLNDYADYLIASEETEPGIGWYYTNWLTKLSANTSMPTTELGKIIVDDCVAQCDKQCNGQKTTLAVVDLAELSATVPSALKNFSVSTTKMIQNDQYEAVSTARSTTREFAPSTKIDQIDLVHLAYNLDTAESKALADTLLGAVKYNKTSSSMTNAYGLSIYFPYQRASKVDSAVATYNAIGMDSEYSRCIQQFASVEVGGQAAAGGSSSPLASLFGSGSSSSPMSGGDISDLLGGLMGSGGGIGSLLGSLTGGNSDFFGKNVDLESTASYIAENQFDQTKLVWSKVNGKNQLSLDEDQWKLVHSVLLNVFFDDGEGYIDLGLDCIYDFTDDGALVGEYDGAWMAIDGQKIAVYLTDQLYEGDDYCLTYRCPVLINGDRANLIIVYDNAHPDGYIAGARYDYINGETETIAKGVTALNDGDKIDLVCDYYNYDGSYENSYMFGDPITYNGHNEISDVEIDASKANATYLFTDIYNNEFWTPVIP